MEKRTLLAFALVFGFLALWNLLFKPQLPPRVPPQAGVALTDSTQLGRPLPPLEGAPGQVLSSAPDSAAGGVQTGAAAAPGAREPAVAAGPTWPGDAGAATGEPIQIVTDHFVAEIDPVGGDILSWKLQSYHTLAGDPVQLVGNRALDRGAQRAHALRLWVGDRALDLRDVRFTPSTTRLELSPAVPQGTLDLSARRSDGAQLRLQYQFRHDAYAFDVRVSAEAPELLENQGSWEVAWPGGVARSEPDSTAEYAMYKAVTRVGADVHRKPFPALGKGDGSAGRGTFEGTVSWAGVLSKYFAALQLTPTGVAGSVHFDGDYARHLQTFMTRAPMQGAGSAAAFAYTVYMGPLDYDRLAAYGADAGKLIDLGVTAFRPVARGTLWVMKTMHAVIPNYGWVIVILSVVLKVAFYPLTKSSTQSMRRMQEIQPRLKKIREKYKDDQQRQSKEMLELYKQHKINPAGGCLPIVVQMPVFWALFNVLRQSIELRQAPFVAWINDLSRPDVLFHLPLSLPIFGDKFCLLPTLMALSMWAQTKLAPTPMPSGDGAVAMQARMMNTLMPIMMFVFFYNSPAGLSLYWLINTVLTAFQTWKIHREMAPLSDAAPEAKPA